MKTVRRSGVLVMTGLLAACQSEPLPELFTLPTFELVDQEGQRFGTEQLTGEVWIATFIFTTCPTVCETLTRRTRQLQERLDARALEARIVTFTVDPEQDSPDVLKAYAARHRADLARWQFLTGPKDACETSSSAGSSSRWRSTSPTMTPP
ncbi:MAG: SCO family protein [Myxococcales bacterium]|nr:SCO family protein [Myxococcales bacterium]